MDDWAMEGLIQALNNIANAIGQLGNGDAEATMGAMEAFGQNQAAAMDNIADAIRFASGREGK